MTTSLSTQSRTICKVNQTKSAWRSYGFRSISEGKMARRFNRHAAAFRF